MGPEFQQNLLARLDEEPRRVDQRGPRVLLAPGLEHQCEGPERVEDLLCALVEEDLTESKVAQSGQEKAPEKIPRPERTRETGRGHWVGEGKHQAYVIQDTAEGAGDSPESSPSSHASARSDESVSVLRLRLPFRLPFPLSDSDDRYDRY